MEKPKIMEKPIFTLTNHREHQKAYLPVSEQLLNSKSTQLKTKFQLLHPKFQIRFAKTPKSIQILTKHQ